jgi:hypothetical protein
MKNIIPSICGVALVAILVLNIHMCNNPDIVTETHTNTVYETVYDSVENIVHVPQPGAVITLPPDTVFVYDEAKCLALHNAFYSKNIYSNVLQDDSNAFISLVDTVFQNKLMGRTLTYKNRVPTEIITTTTTTTNIVADRPRFRLYAGPIVTYVKGNSPGFGGGLLLSTKKWAAGYSYDITNKQNYLSIYFSIIKGKTGN